MAGSTAAGFGGSALELGAGIVAGDKKHIGNGTMGVILTGTGMMFYTGSPAMVSAGVNLFRDGLGEIGEFFG